MSQAEPKKKILITDDEKSTTLLLSAIFKDSYQVDVAHSSHEAILKIHEFQPDLITSDINMPGLEGDDLLPIIRAWKPHIPVLVISGSIDPDIQQKCIDRGASGFIAKPFERIPLLEQVQNIFAGEVPVPIISEKIMNEVELAIMILEREGLITREQSKEEFSKVKSRMKN
jgi:CheY-like chemotaxis protein